MNRILLIPIVVVLFAACDSSVKEAPQGLASEIEALTESKWEEHKLMFITNVPEYHVLFEWEEAGQLSNGGHWGVADAGEFLVELLRMQRLSMKNYKNLDTYRVLATPECTMNKGAWLSGLANFANCVQYVIEYCDTVIYTDSDDGKRLEAHGMNVTFNDDGTVTAVPCNPPDPWKG